MSLGLVLLFMVTPLQEAKAWKLFGKEVTSEVGVRNNEGCGEDCSGIIQNYTTYFLGIPISSGQNTICICP